METLDLDTAPTRRRDSAHHHPRVLRERDGWRWTCSCGSATCRTGQLPSSWRQAVVEALNHSSHLSA